VRLRSGPYHASYWHTDYYELRNGQWQVVWSQSTEIKQAATPPPASMQKGAADG
jgi:hypothetical protein